jgi:hypothetical protein
VIWGGKEVVGKLPGGARRLGAGSIGGEEDRRGTSHGEPEAAAAALGGREFRSGFRGDWGVREHERGPEQLARRLTRIEGARKWLPTVSRGQWSGGRKGDGGARVPGCGAAQAQWRIERLCDREAHEHRIKGSEGALGPCHGGGNVSTDRKFKGAVALVEESVRGKEQARGGRKRRVEGEKQEVER